MREERSLPSPTAVRWTIRIVPAVDGGAIQISGGVEDQGRSRQLSVSATEAMDNAFGIASTARRRQLVDGATSVCAARLRDSKNISILVDHDAPTGQVAIRTEVRAREAVEQRFGPSTGGGTEAEDRAAIVKPGFRAAELRRAIQIARRIKNQLSLGIVSVRAAAKAVQNGLGPRSTP